MTRAVTRAAVLSAGSWGTTFAKVLADAGSEVTLFARRPELAAAITADRENADYLPGVRLPDGITATDDAARALEGADLVVLSIPSQTLRQNLAEWAHLVPADATLLSLMKGIELGSTRRMSEVVREVTGASPDRVAVLSGPNLAREIAEEQPSATVIACADTDRAEALQAACHTRYFRPYTNPDVVGCELGGAVKNVIALAAGVAEGLGFGDNTRASLITRGLAETARLGQALGADPLTFAGLAGLGDLVATCSSPLSRNRTFGEHLGRGMSLEETVAVTRQTAEGVKSCRSVLDLAQAHGVDVPITEAVVRVCHEGESPAQMVREIMSREAKSE
ncbi:NAD(P)H-dependent glycerol-3-phosphate dehydrogenase [Klenkia taihuensis]|uniref:Glycerol-3-phosphate dehydrogenase [NAD(P)+] n=1 Tax=Klenkia taihuensis TaxID=1225127 RepID=A0A1I1KMV1_9ACTN|nr:NAD(P)H-dependent glycerol-3-phosphate dehydrogenase [Klenkia taihuensis]GHE10184.1 glycerol-3-phosphate dehydrogenase [NAD(P)+] [Klenkia taihuensis]SFC62254.1 glycerol 3-phosphate dehydrogenase (NAD(P)+) [Klenkia taihuensis]